MRRKGRLFQLFCMLLMLARPLCAAPTVVQEFFSFSGPVNGNYNTLDPNNGTGFNFSSALLTYQGAVTATSLPPISAPTFDNPFNPAANDDFFLARLTGFFSNATTLTNAIFSTRSDDGSYLFIDGILRVKNGGRHGSTTVNGAGFTLTAGIHTFELQYGEDNGGNTLGISLPAGVVLAMKVPELDARHGTLPLLSLALLLILVAERRRARTHSLCLCLGDQWLESTGGDGPCACQGRGGLGLQALENADHR